MRLVSKDLTIAFIDQVGYTKSAMDLEKRLGAKGVGELNSQIQSLVNHAIGFAGIPRADCVIGTTGDGAILRFDRADDAVIVAAALHSTSAVKALNEPDKNQRWLFRVGIGTGEVAIDVEAVEGNGLAGAALIRAARLEQAAHAGGTLIDVETWAACTPRQQVHFVGPETLVAKHCHEISSYRSFSGSDPRPEKSSEAPELVAQESPNSLDSALSLMNGIRKSWQIDYICLKLDMPMQDMPSASKTIRERYIDIVSWSKIHKSLFKLTAIANSVIG